MCIKISGKQLHNLYEENKYLVIFKAGKIFRSNIRSCYKTICPHGVPPGMFSMGIVEISTESVKACSFHQRKSIPDTEIIYSTFLDTIGSQIAFFLNFYRNLPQYPCCSIRATGIKVDK